MITIVNYGMGNISSVKNALEILGEQVCVGSRAEEILAADKLVIPGVGAFGDCIANLRKLCLVEPLNEAVLKKATPILGICLGMQVMATTGREGGKFAGLNWFDAEVVRVAPSDKKLRIPHVGWDSVDIVSQVKLFDAIPSGIDMYFVHSYYMKCNRAEDISAMFDYGGKFTAAVQKNNIMATQFHPEKSQDFGLKLLKNFIAWKP